MIRHVQDGAAEASAPTGTAGSATEPARPLPRPALSASAEGREGEVRTPELPPTDPDSVTITHSVSQNIVSGNSVACSPDSGFTTTENGYLRTFDLEDFGINRDFQVADVSFGVEASDPAQSLTVNLYTLEGEFIYDNMTLIGSTETTIQPQTLDLVTVPVTATAPAGSTLVVEIDSPDMSGTGRFFIGSNNAGQTAPSYLRSASCGIPEPTDAAALGFPGMHIVMNVTGEVGGGVPWLSVAPATFTLEPGQSAQVTVALDGNVEQPGTYTARIAVGENTPYVVDPVGVTMAVTAPATWGKITGTITSVDCNGVEVPLEGAIVSIDGKMAEVTLITGPDGAYAYWIHTINNPLTVIAAAADHDPQTRQVRLRPGKTVVADFALNQLC